MSVNVERHHSKLCSLWMHADDREAQFDIRVRDGRIARGICEGNEQLLYQVPGSQSPASASPRGAARHSYSRCPFGDARGARAAFVPRAYGVPD